MRRVRVLLLALAAALLVAGCGSSSSSSAAPQSADLSYFPNATPVVAVLDTHAGNPFGSQALAAAKSDPDYALIQAALFSELAKDGINYDRDVKPLFGTPIVVGAGASQVGGGTPVPVLLAWRTASATALSHLTHDLHGLTRTGTHDGATLYALGAKAAVAVDGPLLLVSQNAANLSAALDRHQSGDGFSAAEFARDTAGLPHSALSVAGNPTGLLDTPKAAQARRVPWVDAIDGYGVSLGGSTRSTAHLSFRIDTGGHPLTAAQLPIAAGSAAPALASGGGLPISLALRDPGQVWSFLLAAERTADPSGYAKLEAELVKTRTRTGVDASRFLDSLTGDVQVVSDGTQTIARVTVTPAQAASWERFLAHPADDRTRRVGGGFYELRENGGGTLRAGAVGDTLLFGKASVAQERAFAKLPSTPSHGSGALAVSISVRDLITRALARTGETNPLAGQLAGLLGTLTGTLSASPTALTGSASLPFSLPGQTAG